MTPHQLRVIEEKVALDDKLSKLGTFLHGETFATIDRDEQTRLNRQYSVMTTYSQILSERIATFKN